MPDINLKECHPERGACAESKDPEDISLAQAAVRHFLKNSSLIRLIAALEVS